MVNMVNTKHVAGTVNRLSTMKEVVFPSLEAAKKAGFRSVGCGLLLQAAADASTVVWQIQPNAGGGIQLTARPDIGYDPELRAVDITRNVIASEEGSVDTPYGRGKRTGSTGEGNAVVEFPNGKRYIVAAADVTEVKPVSKTSFKMVAKSPTDASVREYLSQMFFAMYGDQKYADELAKTFGETA